MNDLQMISIIIGSFLLTIGGFISLNSLANCGWICKKEDLDLFFTKNTLGNYHASESGYKFKVPQSNLPPIREADGWNPVAKWYFYDGESWNDKSLGSIPRWSKWHKELNRRQKNAMVLKKSREGIKKFI